MKLLQEMKMVVEGVYTTKSVYHLAKRTCRYAITCALYRVLFEDVPVNESVKELMGRDKS